MSSSPFYNFRLLEETSQIDRDVLTDYHRLALKGPTLEKQELVKALYLPEHSQIIYSICKVILYMKGETKGSHLDLLLFCHM